MKPGNEFGRAGLRLYSGWWEWGRAFGCVALGSCGLLGRLGVCLRYASAA
jgi:hypothetical protein